VKDSYSVTGETVVKEKSSYKKKALYCMRDIRNYLLETGSSMEGGSRGEQL